MLLTKSFEITDSDGINELLVNNHLASGAHILVSDGKVLIPYEDGAPPTTAQRIVELRENQNKLRSEMEIIAHSNHVLAHLVADAEERVNVARAALEAMADKPGEKPTANPARKDAQTKLDQTQQALDQLLNQKLMNEHELVRAQMNIDQYEAAIAKLT